MRLLFVKHSLVWPRSSGHDVHTFHMMKACGELGHEISLATVVPPEPPAVAGAAIKEHIRLSAPIGNDAEPLPGTKLQHRFRSFWGVEDHWVRSLRAAVRRIRPDAVIVGGLDALPYFPAMENTVRIWYAADEWVLHHLSMLRFRKGQFMENLRGAAMKGLYERAHRHVIDRAWVVTERDRRAMQRVAGVSNVDLLPNGVDADFFKPGQAAEPNTCVFWGRLDFGPNIQALEWFCSRVWPEVRRAVPDGRFTVIGFQPTDEVKKLAEAPGITLVPNVRDLRALARSHQVVVLPFVSGAGIKNKLLEAAALGLPVVGTPTALMGLRGTPPIRTASNPQELGRLIVNLWKDPARAAEIGAQSRAWVLEHHSWTTAAREAMQALGDSTKK